MQSLEGYVSSYECLTRIVYDSSYVVLGLQHELVLVKKSIMVESVSSVSFAWARR